ncbi:MAG: sulfatase-like hydrolase/transferase, partial [Acidobacteriota bacterium]
LVALNRKGEMPRQEVLDYFQAVYDSQIRHVDDVLRKFFAALEAEGLLEDLTVVLTSDHGEEFGEHGELLHNQIYRETLHVPLLLVHPSLETGKRIPDLVQSIDIAPTFYDIAGIEPPQAISGKSLVPLAEGAVEAPRQAFAETWDGQSRGLIRQTEGGLHQLVWSTPPSKGEWAWITQRGEMIFDTFGQEWVAEAASFHVPRQVEILVDGKPVDDPGFDPMVSPDGTTLRLQLPQDDRKKRVTVRATSCEVPAELGLSEDPRCLSIRLRVSDLWRIQLFDNASDPLQARDLSGEDSGLSRSMLRQLGAHRPEPLFTAGERELDPELEARLRALGYLND